jgi:hypothetical protein
VSVQILGGHILAGTVTFDDLVSGVFASPDGVYEVETIAEVQTPKFILCSAATHLLSFGTKQLMDDASSKLTFKVFREVVNPT